MNDFMTVGLLATFAGLVLAVALIVQFTKSVIKKRFGDVSVRLYAFIVSLVLTFVFAPSGSGVQGVILTVINAMLICMAAMGGYEAIADPLAEKQRQE
jgi:predicted membrane channel-forming protein YqfA (hemolysin III family)